MLTRATRIGLWVWGARVVAFLWLPLLIMGVYAFNSSNVQSWPIPGFTTKWFSEAWHDEEVRDALWLSVQAGLTATAVALVLGSLAAFGARAGRRFFGQDAISFVFVLPIALPGDHHGHGPELVLHVLVASSSTSGRSSSVTPPSASSIVFNNVLARLRRTSGSFFEASADLGAYGWQTFRYVTFPVVRTAIVAGALLAFALSWDEIVVTYFTAGAQNTLPLLIFGMIRQGQELPIVNAIALFVIVVSDHPGVRSRSGSRRRRRRPSADRRARAQADAAPVPIGQLTPVPPSPQ